MAGYVVIAADGVLTHHPEPPTLERINTAVGPEGWARVRLLAGRSGFVNDCGFLAGYDRNPVGACVLACLGAGRQPYAGPVVITGWDDNPAGDALEIRPLSDLELDSLTHTHRLVQKSLVGDDMEIPHLAPKLREYAEFVRSAPAPGLTVLSGEDALRALRGDRRG